MTNLLVVSIVLNVVAITSLVLGALVFRDALQTQARLTDRVHERDGKHITGLVDRLIAGDYRTFREYPDEDEVGGMELPEDEEAIEVVGGVQRQSTESMRASAEEDLILREDFPEQFAKEPT